MEFVFLGTSSGAPTKTRNVAGLAIKKAGSKSWYLVDCGEGTQHQILHTNLSLNHLEAICITHVHGDHCFGLPGLIASATMSGRTKTLTIICPSALKSYIQMALEISESRLSYDIDIHDVESLSEIDSHDFSIQISELSHRVPSFSYHFLEKNIKARLDVEKLKQEGIPSGPLWGKLQTEESVTLANGEIVMSAEYFLPPRKARKIIIAGDNDNPELLAEYAKQADVLVHEATFTDAISEKVGKGPQHSTAKSVAQFAESVDLPYLVLTHFSARYQDDSENTRGSIVEIENEAKDYYSGRLFLAKDFDKFHLDMDGQLHLSQ